jgi:hypothetical protein
MALPILSISCNVYYQLNFFISTGKKVLAFNRDGCCHLAFCFQLILFHWNFIKLKPFLIAGTNQVRTLLNFFSSSLTLRQNKLVCWSLASFFGLYLWVNNPRRLKNYYNTNTLAYSPAASVTKKKVL